MPNAVRTRALIVAHGAPSAPQGPEAALGELAATVEALLGSGWAVRSATLAMPGALASALAALGGSDGVLVHPHFMADGWFSTEELPRRLRKAGAAGFEMLPAYGLDPAVLQLCLARAGAIEAGPEAAVLVAAHGHPSDPRAAAAARVVAEELAASGRFREVRCGFIDESPFLAEAARLAAPAFCLPFFAQRAGHVETDVPAALAEAGFSGPVLEPVGVGAGVPGIVAGALKRAAAQRPC